MLCCQVMDVDIVLREFVWWVKGQIGHYHYELKIFFSLVEEIIRYFIKVSVEMQ